MTETSISDRAAHLLNGRSVRRVQRQRLVGGDLLFGELLERRQSTNGRGTPLHILTLRLLEPGRAGGEPLAEGDWICVPCDSSVLRRFVEREDPQPGWHVAIQHRGKTAGQLDVVAGCEKPDGGAGTPW